MVLDFKKGIEMNITRKNILGVGQGTSLVNTGWLRPHTPYKKDGKEKMVDSVEFEINHHGIEKLEENVDNETEYIMCFVHFDAGTENLDGIYFAVWDENAAQDDPIVPILDEAEKKILVNYALEELRECR